MPGNPQRRRRSIRLQMHDYATPGAYFVTACAFQRRCTLDHTAIREAIETAWRDIPLHFSCARADQFIVMPNHIHGIIWILNVPNERQPHVGAQHAAPLRPDAARLPAVQPGSLGAIVRSFKSATARHINQIRRTSGAPVWQRNYYERVIRDEDELLRVREYISVNPARWQFDRENPCRLVDGAYEAEWDWLEGQKPPTPSARS